MLDKNKVVVAMSGGVDSTVVAYLLKEAGMEVVGMHMKVWHTIDSQVESDFLRVCEQLQIESVVIDVSEEFKDKVIDYFIDAYKNGLTPNPCVVCNKHIKFGLLLDEAKKQGAYYLATGHYANIIEEDGIYYMEKADSSKKDQTYMFYNFNQDIMKHVLMPLGKFESKDEIRKIAENIDIEVSKKKDSQEICFVPNDDYVAFLKTHGVDDMKGDFIDSDGKTLGQHKGMINYTIGQRKGLGITFGKPTYVIDIEPQRKAILLGDNEDLFTNELIATEFNYISNDFIEGKTYTSKIRYSSIYSNCTIKRISNEEIKVTFEEKQRAVTPGQSVVFYDGNRLLGGAVIKNKLK